MTHRTGSRGAAGVACVLALALLSGCGPRPPTLSFGANLDANCEPQDIIDQIGAAISPESFWREQEYDMLSYIDKGEKNLKNLQFLLDDNLKGRGEFQTLVRTRAKELGITGSDFKEMLEENMKDFDALGDKYKERIRAQLAELAWSRKCFAVAREKIRAMGLTPRDRKAGIGYTRPR